MRARPHDRMLETHPATSGRRERHLAVTKRHRRFDMNTLGRRKITDRFGDSALRLFAVVVAGAAALVVAGVAFASSSRPPAAPTNSSLPHINGTAVVGGALTANPGTWSGSAPLSFQYQWLICGEYGESCHAISGATGQTYQPRVDDPGNRVRVDVIASNSDGSSKATSDASARVAAPSRAASTSPPTVSGNPTV